MRIKTTDTDLKQQVISTLMKISDCTESSVNIDSLVTGLNVDDICVYQNNQNLQVNNPISSLNQNRIFQRTLAPKLKSNSEDLS
jgi:hypothetical protein